MITPKFDLDQDGFFVYINIYAPYTKIINAEIYADGNTFYFSSKPYFLRLTLPGNILEDDKSSCQYHANNGKFEIRISKAKHHEFFEGLDMYTSLLTSKRKGKPAAQLIEEISTKGDLSENEQDTEEDINWDTSQSEVNNDLDVLQGSKYGFASSKSGVFTTLQDEAYGLVDLAFPDSIQACKRRVLREEDEDMKFNCDHYLADLFDNTDIQNYITFRPPWVHQFNIMEERLKTLRKDHDMSANLPVCNNVALSKECKVDIGTSDDKKIMTDSSIDNSVYLDNLEASINRLVIDDACRKKGDGVCCPNSISCKDLSSGGDKSTPKEYLCSRLECSQNLCPINNSEKKTNLQSNAPRITDSTEIIESSVIQSYSRENYIPFDEVLERSKLVKELVQLTDGDRDFMRCLSRKNYLLSKGELKEVYLGLIDLLFSYCYNYRVTEGENCVESAWTISRLSAMLCWLESKESLYDVVTGSMRRSLIFPIFRHWDLSLAVLSDVVILLSLGRRRILQCMIEMEGIMKVPDQNLPYYILNDLYIAPYCAWIQTASDVKLRSLATRIKEINLSKQSVALGLEIYEEIALKDNLFLNNHKSQDNSEETSSESDSSSSNQSSANHSSHSSEE